jgi:hypothetical protein
VSLLDFGLRLEGLPEETITELDAHLPHITRLVIALKQAEPFITQLMPVLTKAWPDIVAITPLVKQITTFIEQKEKES